jgi:hypothetical protein
MLAQKPTLLKVRRVVYIHRFCRFACDVVRSGSAALLSHESNDPPITMCSCTAKVTRWQSSIFIRLLATCAVVASAR